jgi:hypothetical protein
MRWVPARRPASTPSGLAARQAAVAPAPAPGKLPTKPAPASSNRPVGVAGSRAACTTASTTSPRQTGAILWRPEPSTLTVSWGARNKAAVGPGAWGGVDVTAAEDDGWRGCVLDGLLGQGLVTQVVVERGLGPDWRGRGGGQRAPWTHASGSSDVVNSHNRSGSVVAGPKVGRGSSRLMWTPSGAATVSVSGASHSGLHISLRRAPPCTVRAPFTRDVL